MVLGAIPIQTFMRKAFLTTDKDCENSDQGIVSYSPYILLSSVTFMTVSWLVQETCASKICTSDDCESSTVELFENEVIDVQASVTRLTYSTYMKF